MKAENIKTSRSKTLALSTKHACFKILQNLEKIFEVNFTSFSLEIQLLIVL